MKRVLLAPLLILVWSIFFGVSISVRLSVRAAARTSSPSSPRTAAREAESQIRAVLASQVEAWNRGDIDAFMQGYWKSESTEFIGSTGVQRGWRAVRDRYRQAYPDRRSMGTLTFSNLEVTVLSPNAALVLGEWRLKRAADRPGGVFTLILRKLSEGWRIINDHTSAVSSK